MVYRWSCHAPVGVRPPKSDLKTAGGLQLESARSFEITFWRALFTAVSLLLILPFFQGRAVFVKVAQGGRAFWISGVCWSVMFTAFMVALTLTSVANVLVTMSIGPLLTALMARASCASGWG